MAGMATRYDLCECGRRKRDKSKRCAKCAGYGTKRHVMPSGYVRVWEPGHPLANSDGHVLEHRKVLYDAGVEIAKGTHVHHINGDKLDNRRKNLMVKTPVAHVNDHIAERGGGVANQFGVWPLRGNKSCEQCGTPFKVWSDTSRFCSRACYYASL